MIKKTFHVARLPVESCKHLKGMFRTLSNINRAFQIIAGL